MLNKTVFIGKGAFFRDAEEMFWRYGWKVTPTPIDSDFLCLLGGGDISPALYGEKALKSTSYHNSTDEYDLALIDLYKDRPKLGICRGGQLLNVVSGGKMWQHVNRHGGKHIAFDKAANRTFEVSSIHHQEMIPGDNAEILAVAYQATEKLGFERQIHAKTEGKVIGEDIEALYYDNTKSFCYQPHPEIGPQSCTNYFFEVIDRVYFS